MCLYHYDHNCKHSKVKICKLPVSQRWLDSNTNDIQRNQEKICSKQGLIFHLRCGIGQQDPGWQPEFPQLPLLQGSHAPRYSHGDLRASAAMPRGAGCIWTLRIGLILATLLVAGAVVANTPPAQALGTQQLAGARGFAGAAWRAAWMGAGSLQTPLHSPDLQGSQRDVGLRTVPSLVPASRAGTAQPQTSLPSWACAANPCHYPEGSPSILCVPA